MPKLLLIDGHALAFRSFYATAHTGSVMTTAQGEWTNAVYLFMAKLLKVWAEEKPDYIVVAFDVGKTFRHEEFPDYKAQRAKSPQELHDQVERIKQVVQAFSIPIVTCEGFEADDVLGTLARQAAEQGLDTLILTGDNDILQLVDAQTHVLAPGGRGNEDRLFGPAEVSERYGGLTPAQLTDLKALIGDNSDNIPGIRGIGDKSAIPLIREHGSVEGIYDHLDDMNNKRARAALDGHRQDALLYKRLVTIRRDAPVTLDLAQAQAGRFDVAAVTRLLTELEFHSLLSRLPAGNGTGAAGLTAAAQPTIATRYICVDNEAALRDMVAALRAAGAFALDTETTSVQAMQAGLVGFSAATAAGQAWYVPLGHRRQAQNGDPSGLEQLPLFTASSPLERDERQLPFNVVIEQIRPILQDPAIAKYAHHAGFDMTVLAQAADVHVQGLTFDTMIAAWLLQPESRALGLKDQAAQRLGVAMTPIQNLIGQGAGQITFDRVPIADAVPYACADADMTWRLVESLSQELRQRQQWDLFTRIEMPLAPILTRMKMAGVRLDVAYLRNMSQELDAEARRIEEQIYQLAGRRFNVNSTKQLGDVLFEELKLPRQGVRKTVHGYSTAADVLELLRDKHPIVPLILEQRQVAKLKSTYVDALPDLVNPRTGRIHTSYNQTGAVTGRLSSSDPNLQNIPIRTEMGRKIRRGFVAEPGWRFLAADYSQIELRVLAYVSQDAALLDAFARNQDVHARTAAAIYGVPLEQVTSDQRRVAKTVNFGLIYGQSAYGLSQQTDLFFDEAERFIQAYFEHYPGVKQWLDSTRRLAYTQGYVETLLGRRRYFPELSASTNAAPSYAGQRAAAERQAINAPIQGTAADILKIAMIRLDEELRRMDAQARMVLQVHDELVLEIPAAELNEVAALVRQVMESAFPLSVPLLVDMEVGENWLDMAALSG